MAEARLEVLLTPIADEPPDLFEAMRYAVLGSGKRLRPALCMASAAAVGGQAESALDAGCAVELVHCFSLVHDDLPAIDDDALRRGQPTVHVKFGEALAVLAGDALFALAFEVLAQDPRVDAAAIRLLAEASGPRGLVGGEVADVLAEGKPTGPDAVRRIHQRKTGALIRAACAIGARFGGGSEADGVRLTAFGEHAGLAFQIADDLLNELSTAAALGKSAGSDRVRQKATYPAAFGPEAARNIAQSEIESALAVVSDYGPSADDLRLFAHYVVERMS